SSLASSSASCEAISSPLASNAASAASPVCDDLPRDRSANSMPSRLRSSDRRPSSVLCNRNSASFRAMARHLLRVCFLRLSEPWEPLKVRGYIRFVRLTCILGPPDGYYRSQTAVFQKTSGLLVESCPFRPVRSLSLTLNWWDRIPDPAGISETYTVQAGWRLQNCRRTGVGMTSGS